MSDSDPWMRRAAVKNLRESGSGAELHRLDPWAGLVFGYHDVDRECNCVSYHSPVPQHLVRHHIVPLSYGGPDTEDNIVWLCPTAHGNVHKLLWDYERYEGLPPWEGVRWHYSAFIRRLAERAWEWKVLYAVE